MIDARKLPITACIYTYVDPATQVNTHIHIDPLRLWCLENKPNYGAAPVSMEKANTFYKDNCIDATRCISLIPLLAKKMEPIIFCKTGELRDGDGAPNVLLADGRHRYYIFATARIPRIPAFVVEYDDWQPFRISNDSWLDMTEDQLKAIPTSRPHHKQTAE